MRAAREEPTALSPWWSQKATISFYRPQWCKGQESSLKPLPQRETFDCRAVNSRREQPGEHCA